MQFSATLQQKAEITQAIVVSLEEPILGKGGHSWELYIVHLIHKDKVKTYIYILKPHSISRKVCSKKDLNSGI
jgi:hypothetical protein